MQPSSNPASPQNRVPVWGILIAIGMALLAGQPYVLGRLVLGTDTTFHAHRLWQTVQMIRDGYIFARWAPDIAYGFGVPLFNAHGPLPYYVAAPLAFLAGGQIYLAYLLALIGFLVLTSVGAYLWLRLHFGEWGGLMGAAAFVFASDVMNNMSLRGTLPEPFAFAMLPFTLWATERVIAGRRNFVWVGALCYAALALNHNATLMLFTPTLLLYALVLTLAHTQGRARVVVLGQLALMLMWGAALAAFYIVPAFIERGDIRLDRLLAKPELNYRNSFLWLGWLLSNPIPLDEAMMARDYPIHLGATTLLLSALALLALARRQRAITVRVLISLALAALCTFMMLPQAQPIWEAAPLLQMLQFVRRFAPLASLWLAPLVAAGGWAVLQLKGRWLRAVFPAIAIGALAVTAFPTQFPQATVPLNRHLDARVVMQDEVDMHAFGTTVAGEYTPASNKELPPPAQSPLLRGGQRLDAASLPAGVTVSQERYRPLDYAVSFAAAQPFTATFHTFVYPGWVAFVDGAAVPMTPSDPYGFIQINVPAGKHMVQVAWGSTPLRRATDIISIAAWLALALCLAWFIYRTIRAILAAGSPRPVSQLSSASDRETQSLQTSLLVLLVMGSLFAFKTFIADVRETPWRTSRFDGQNIKDLAQQVNVNFGGRMIFMGAEHEASVASGGVLNANLYWRVTQQSPDNFSTSLQAVDANGVRIGVSDHQHPSRAPTSWNGVHNYTRDAHALRIAPGTPPGQYTLRVQAAPFDQFDKPLPVLNEAGSVAGVFHELGTFTVQRPVAPPSPSDLHIGQPLTPLTDSPIQLIGFDLPQRAARTGDRLLVNLFWRAQAAPGRDIAFQFVFTGKDGSAISTPARALVEGYATNAWQAGDVWRGTHAVLVPPKLSSGAYAVSVQLEGALAVVLGELQVAAPTRVFEMPSVVMVQRNEFGGVAALVGYTLSPTQAVRGQPVSVALVWQAMSETPVSYKVFVHLLDGAGKLIASDDAIPAQWQRPTPGWATDEFVLDAHTLNLAPDLPAGTYTLRVGLYEEGGAGARLALPGGEVFVVLSRAISVLP